ncbi:MULTISPECIES: hypothetical protein [Sutcliffiella]|uniref:Uncharacterized protein n=1 Tax=Sutcliffiella cohnii TaxID=33932 RepID=A0A223KM09_9BACI|nr:MULTISPECIES: hypothetical protein [Sutcliffiella]AST90418.1 hypothetical protein BC6307_03590 [Sutcliffiella cohnii]MED4017465.1 hypothetical protein [Sutcliffiella cohnii]WBL16073.1 hypothetical protein O1A01_05410 [Sutcliffiella sp. NC1]
MNLKQHFLVEDWILNTNYDFSLFARNHSYALLDREDDLALRFCIEDEVIQVKKMNGWNCTFTIDTKKKVITFYQELED